MEVKTLIATKNIKYIKYIFYIISEIKNLRIMCITTNKEETLELLKKKQFDLIILDFKMINLDSIKSIKNISNIIFISEDSTSFNKIINHPMVIDVIDKIDNSYCKVKNIIEDKMLMVKQNNIEQYIINELNLLGYDFKYKGIQYLLEAILYIYKNKKLKLLQNLEKNVYSYVATVNNTSILNVKTSIIRATNYMYIYQSDKTKDKYFSFNYKPTPKTVITTIILKINCFD